MAGPIEMDTTFEDAGGNTSVPLQNGSFHDRIGTRWDMLKLVEYFDCHAGSVATISVGST